jgi:phosphatidylglycerophosphate synthase
MANTPVTLTDRVRAFTGGFMSWLGTTLYGIGVHPDMVTVLGLAIVGVAAIFIGRGDLRIGGLILLVGLPLDAVDGAVARAMGRTGRFGAMLDSTLDRYADGLIFSALSYHFAVRDQFDLVTLAMAALLGSFMVSYTRARGESVGVDVKIGLFTRMERVVVILVMLLAPASLGIPALEIGLLVLALGTNFTGMQRLWFVYRTLKDREG